MSNIIIPNQAPPVQTGIAVNAGQDGGVVFLRVTTTWAFPSLEDAQAFADGLDRAIELARATRTAIEQPMGNGVIHA